MRPLVFVVLALAVASVCAREATADNFVDAEDAEAIREAAALDPKFAARVHVDRAEVATAAEQKAEVRTEAKKSEAAPAAAPKHAPAVDEAAVQRAEAEQLAKEEEEAEKLIDPDTPASKRKQQQQAPAMRFAEQRAQLLTMIAAPVRQYPAKEFMGSYVCSLKASDGSDKHMLCPFPQGSCCEGLFTCCQPGFSCAGTPENPQCLRLPGTQLPIHFAPIIVVKTDASKPGGMTKKAKDYASRKPTQGAGKAMTAKPPSPNDGPLSVPKKKKISKRKREMKLVKQKEKGVNKAMAAAKGTLAGKKGKKAAKRAAKRAAARAAAEAAGKPLSLKQQLGGLSVKELGLDKKKAKKAKKAQSKKQKLMVVLRNRNHMSKKVGGRR